MKIKLIKNDSLSPKKLIAIQNNALRIIYIQDRFTSTRTLLQIGDEVSLKTRLDALKEKYF